MTVSSIKVKVLRTPVIKAKLLANFPANVVGANGITVDKANGTYTIRPDYSSLVQLSNFDPSQEQVIVYNPSTATWNVVLLASLFTGAQTVQIITAAGDVTVQPNDGLIVLNKTVGAATNVNLPAAALKVGDVKIVDWKNDSDVNNITIVPNGTEKINGLTSWKLAGQGASIILKPVSGTVSGYVA
jgi:hypothetical protein